MASPRPYLLLLVGLFAALPALAADMFCCQDPVTNRRVCGDVVPEQCKGRGYKIIDSSGNVVKEVGPPMTAEQLANQKAEAKRKKEMEAAAREQRRRDAALLETYANVQEIENNRLRSEQEVIVGMKQAEARIAEAQKRRKKFEDEAEFYKKRELPIEVARGLKDADDEINAQNALLTSKQQDLERVRAKFAEDKKRYLEILSRGGTDIHPAAAGKSPADLRPR